MKNTRFYLEFGTKANKKKNQNTGNVIAIFTDVKPYDINGSVMMQGVKATTSIPDSEVEPNGISQEYLRDTCKLISEDIARIIHPKLFESL
jgi:hypothetical protein